ncbi:MAG: sensor domain-containing diguanylate cyclase [Desulfobacterales bacterium]|nr:sensor domain-containing diguanylate cyclase [Desulfobacterales bacterium]
MNIDYDNLMENLYDGLYLVDPERKITYWNNAAERITGFSTQEVVGRSCSDNILIHIDGKGQSLCLGMCPLAATIADGHSRESEVYLHHKDGHRVPVSVRTTALYDTDGYIVGGAELFTDLSQKDSLSLKIEELEKLAFLDNLTQLANRRYIEMELEARLSEKLRCNLSFGILFMDIDHFKNFNDTYGHDIGDLVLKIVSNTFKSTGRPYDLFGRWGGEEFIGIIRNVDHAGLVNIGERIRRLVEKTFIHVSEKLLNVTVSIGATMAKDSDSMASLTKRSDDLLYMSKKNGRNRMTSDLNSK